MMARASKDPKKISPIGQRIRRAMFDKNIDTIVELENMAKVPRDSVRRLLSGRTKNLDHHKYAPIAKALGLSVSELLGGAPEADPQNAMPLPTGITGGNLGWLAAADDAMSPTISSGDVVLVDWAVNEVAGAGIYALKLDGNTSVLRRLNRKLSGKGIVVKADNQAYSDETEVTAGQLKVAGRVVGIFKRL